MKILREFTVLHEGWELDNTGTVYLNEDGEEVIEFTNHGSPYIPSDEEILEKLKEYEECSIELKKYLHRKGLRS